MDVVLKGSIIFVCGVVALLANPHIGEFFIIGTFTSLLWAADFAGAAWWAVRLW